MGERRREAGATDKNAIMTRGGGEMRDERREQREPRMGLAEKVLVLIVLHNRHRSWQFFLFVIV